MGKATLGALVGAVLGLADGLSAWFVPEARPMIAAIVAGSTLKGVATGAAAGWVARRRRSLGLGIAAGTAVGFVLSTVAAQGQPGHYWEIVLPGMLLGAIVGYVTQRYPRPSLAAGALAALAVLAVAAPGRAAAQAAPAEDPLARLAPLIGRWTGPTEGQPGKGSVERTYERVLGGRFIQVRNVSTYPPQAANPKGERHEDLGLFSYDRARKTIVFRQFHVEGFVNQYVADASAADGRLVFTSEAIENIPAGWRARETYVMSGDRLEEVFELAEPGKDFAEYSRNRLARAR
jgi:hypothetical protein